MPFTWNPMARTPDLKSYDKIYLATHAFFM
jgi:hypothetical protein